MPSKNKQRGNRLERAVVKLAHSLGLSAKRSWASDGRSLGLHAEVDVVIDGMTFQCKKRRRIASYLTPSNNVYGQIVSQDRGGYYVVLRLQDYLLERRERNE